MRFRDRADAAKELAGALHAYRGKHPLVLAIPRGAVPMGRVLAAGLGGERAAAVFDPLAQFLHLFRRQCHATVSPVAAQGSPVA